MILKKICFTCVIVTLLFSYFPIFAQTNFGIRLEPIFYTAKIKTATFSLVSNASDDYSLNVNLILTLNLSLKVTEETKLLIRPGYVFGSLYNGVDGELLIGIDLTEKNYLLAGINAHNNFATGGNSRAGREIGFTYIVLGIGQKINKVNSLELQFNYSFNQIEYGHIYKPDELQMFDVRYSYNMLWNVKLSFGFDWEL